MADNDDIVQKVRIDVEDDNLDFGKIDFKGFEKLQENAKGVFDSINESAKSTFQTIEEFSKSSRFDNAFDSLKSKSTENLDAIKQSFTEFGESMTKALGEDKAPVGFFDKIAEAAKEAFRAIEEAGSGDFGKQFRILKEEGEDTFHVIKEAAKLAFDEIKKATEGGDFGKAFSTVKELGSQAFDILKDNAARAFGAIKEIGTTAFGGLENVVGGARSEIVEHLNAIGITGTRVLVGLGATFVGLATAVGFAIKAAISFTESQNEITNALGEISEKTHTAIGDVDALEKAYAHGGVSAKEFASGYSHLSDVVEKMWDKIKKDTETGVDTLEQRSIAAAKAAGALSKIEKERSEANNDNNQPNTRPVNPFQGDLATAEDAEKALQKELELRQARLAAREAERAENEARRNDISQITKGVQGLIEGNQDALKGFNASAENIVKGVVAAAGKGAETLDKMGEAFASVGSKAPEVKDVLATLAVTLGKIEDPALRSRVALTALGSSGQAFLSALDSGNVEKFTANIDKMRGSVTETDKKIAGDLKSALTGLSADLSTIGTSIASAFGPGFTEAVTKFDEFLARRSEVKGFAETIASGLGSALSAITGGFVKLAETVSGTFDLIGRFSKALDDLKHGAPFKVIKEDAKSLFDTLVAIDKVSASNDEQSKEGAKELTDLRKKEFDQEKKHDEEQGKKKQEDKSRPVLPESSIRAAEDAENARRAASGQPPLEPVDRSAPPPPAPKDEPTGGFLPGVETIRSIIETLKNIGKTLGEDLPKKKAENEGPQPQQVAELTPEKTDAATTSVTETIKNSLQPLIDTINTLGAKKNEPLTGPATGLGIRGDAAEEAAQANKQMADASQAAVDPLTELKTAALGAAQSLNSVNDNNNNESSNVTAADGGHIRGPGTATSDSIPAMLSDGEYVIRKSAVDQIGIAALDAINAGRAHFADGGEVKRRRLPDGRIEEITFGLDGRELSKTTYDSEADADGKTKPSSNQRDVNGNYVSNSGRDVNGNVVDRSGRDVNGNTSRDTLDSVIATAKEADRRNSSGGSDKEGPYTQEGNFGASQQAVIDSLNEASQAEADADPNFIPILLKNRKRHAEGGLIGDVARALNNIKLPRFADGGMISMAPHLPRFADGGMVSVAPRLPRFADGGAVGYQDSGGNDMQHLGTVDLRTDHGPIRVAVDGGGFSQLRKAAVQRNIGSSPKSSWVK